MCGYMIWGWGGCCLLSWFKFCLVYYDIDIVIRNYLYVDNLFISYKVVIEWGFGDFRNFFVLIVNGDGLNFDDVMKRNGSCDEYF